MSGGTGGRDAIRGADHDDPVRFKLTRSGATSTLSINFIDQARPGKPATTRTRQPATCPTSPTR